MANGNNVIAQLAIESTYGVAPTMVKQVRIASEGFKWTPEKKDEGLLTGGKSTGRVYTMSVKSEGSLSTNVRPDEAGYWIGSAYPRPFLSACFSACRFSGKTPRQPRSLRPEKSLR